MLGLAVGPASRSCIVPAAARERLGRRRWRHERHARRIRRSARRGTGAAAREIEPRATSGSRSRAARAARRAQPRATLAVADGRGGGGDARAASSLITASLLRHDEAATAQRSPRRRVRSWRRRPSGPARPSARYLAARRTSPFARGAHRKAASGRRLQLERNLAELRRASEEINAALALSPGDPLLEELPAQRVPGRARGARERERDGCPNGGPANDPTRMQL